MATQSDVLKAINSKGFYTASLYEFDEGSVCVRGIREVSPAEKLVGKGVLVLEKETKESFSGGQVTHFTWVKAAQKDND